MSRKYSVLPDISGGEGGLSLFLWYGRLRKIARMNGAVFADFGGSEGGLSLFVTWKDCAKSFELKMQSYTGT